MNVRIFFSSPGDVTMERETAKRIVDRLQSEIGGVASLQPYFWEHEVMVATKDYQENIPHMDDFDIVVCILWSRLGTPLDPARHPKPGGGGFKSGTEYEFFTAMQAHELKGTPDIFVFRNTTEPRRPSRPKEIREKVDREIDRLDDFFDTYFQDEQFFTRAINIYSTLGEFEEKLTIALRAYLTGRLPAATAEGETKYRPKYGRQPYLGLSAFDYEDAPVFFGRTAEVGEIIAAYQAQEMEANGSADSPPKHFTLILGSSGSGKSSLARAGVLPMLTNPGVIEGANAWRTAIFKPADVPGDPILALVQSLASGHALPELFADGTTPKEIADLIRTQPQGGGLLLRQALTQAGAQALTKQRHEMQKRLDLLVAENRPEDAELLRERIANLTTPSVRIALLADQLEELFTSDLSPDTLATFVRILVALANSGRVFVLATLRSDFYPRCLEHPELVALMQGSGTYALPAPTAVDIGQMIRQPAAIAGLTFEENTSTGEKLDELLRDAALKDPAALPLLSYTLEQLYEQRTDRGLLTLRAYEELGGLEGAIGSRAETVFSSLPGDAQGAFDGLCKQLVTLQEGGEPTRRRAFYTTLTRTPESKTLLDALVNARLLTADQSPSGERIISVAHEALLRHWPRLVSWVEENRLFLNTRTRVASRLADWVEKGKTDDYLIPRGPNLSAAESILTGHLASLDPLEIEFIGRSAERVRREDQRKLRNARLITAGAVVLSIIAIAGGILAMFANSAAQKERRIAEIQRKNALEARAKAVAGETRIAYTKGIQLLENGRERDGLTALAQTLAIQPEHRGALARIYSEQLYSMPRPLPVFSATCGEKFRQRLAGAVHGKRQYVIHLNAENRPALYDINSGKAVPGPWESSPESSFPMVSYGGERVVSIAKDMKLVEWDVESGKQGTPSQLDAKFNNLFVTMDGRYFAESKASGEIRIVSTVTGKEAKAWKVTGTPLCVVACGSRYFISLSDTEMRIFDMESGKLSDPVAPPEGYKFQYAVPAYPRDPAKDAYRCVVNLTSLNAYATEPSQLLFLDAAKGEFIESAKTPALPYIMSFMPNEDGTAVAVAAMKRDVTLYFADPDKKSVSYPDTLSSTLVTISPDNQLLATCASDGTVNIFDPEEAVRLFSPAHHEGQVHDISITSDGRHMLTSTKRTATVWNLSTGGGLTMRLPFNGNPTSTHLKGETLHIKTETTNKDGNWAFHLNRINVAKMKPAGAVVTLPEKAQGTLPNFTMDTIATYMANGEIGFYDVSGTQAVFKSLWKSPGKDVASWGLSKDGSLFVSIFKDKLHIVRTSDASIVSSRDIPDTVNRGLQFSPDNKLLIGLFDSPPNSGELPSIKIWNTADLGDAPFVIPDLYYTNFTISPDGRWLSASTVGERYNPETNFVLFDLSKPTAPPKSYPHSDEIRQMTFSSDSAMLGIAGVSGTLRVWTMEGMDFTDAPLAEKASQIDQFTFSDDFQFIATITTTGGQSSVRVWDWKEAAPISAPWVFDALVTQVHFSADGSKLIAIAKGGDEGNPDEHFVHLREIMPPDEVAPQILPLTQAAVAKMILQNSTPIPTAPGIIWETIAGQSRDSWLLKPPVDRDLSPGIEIPTTNWMNLDGLRTQEMTRAMPRVPISHAKMAEWRQIALSNLNAPSDETPEARDRRLGRAKALAESIAASVDFAERNLAGDSETCYRLAQQARTAGENERSLRFLTEALRIDPKNENSLHLSAVIATDEARHADAKGLFETLVGLDPENPNYRAKFALSLIELGKEPQALEEMKKVIDDPSLEDRLIALSLTALGRHEEALPAYQRMADAGGGAYGPSELVYLITGNHFAGNDEIAVERYAELIRLQPGAADPEIVKSANLIKCVTTALLETLAKHPELAPQAPE